VRKGEGNTSGNKTRKLDLKESLKPSLTPYFLEDPFSDNNSAHTYHPNSFILGSPDYIGKAADSGEDQRSTESRTDV
jgi:hypothetical protein